MSAKRTVDPEGKLASTRFLGLRVTVEQWTTIELLCSMRRVSKSALLRQLVQEAYENVPEPF
jgi:hypothetical protein